jgi:hypothetical protein
MTYSYCKIIIQDVVIKEFQLMIHNNHLSCGNKGISVNDSQ